MLRATSATVERMRTDIGADVGARTLSPPASPSTLTLCTDPARAPRHRTLDAKLVEKEILVTVLNTWLLGGDEEDEDDRHLYGTEGELDRRNRKLADASAIAFALMDARFAVTLYPRYRVRSEMELSTVLRTWERPLASIGERSRVAAVGPLPAYTSPPLIPLFRLVTSDDPQSYTNVHPQLLARIATPKFSRISEDANATDIPTGTTVFEYRGEDTISANVLPTSLQQLIISPFSRFNQPIGVNVLPTSLRQLTFGYRFDQPIGVGVLPASLQQLTFGRSFNQPIDANVLPASLKQLKFHGAFNQRIGVNVLPTSLKQLTFGESFNQPIGVNVLPASLQYLSFGCQPTDRLERAPGSATAVDFRSWFQPANRCSRAACVVAAVDAWWQLQPTDRRECATGVAAAVDVRRRVQSADRCGRVAHVFAAVDV